MHTSDFPRSIVRRHQGPQMAQAAKPTRPGSHIQGAACVRTAQRQRRGWKYTKCRGGEQQLQWCSGVQGH